MELLFIWHFWSSFAISTKNQFSPQPAFIKHLLVIIIEFIRQLFCHGIILIDHFKIIQNNFEFYPVSFHRTKKSIFLFVLENSSFIFLQENSISEWTDSRFTVKNYINEYVSNGAIIINYGYSEIYFDLLFSFVRLHLDCDSLFYQFYTICSHYFYKSYLKQHEAISTVTC